MDNKSIPTPANGLSSSKRIPEVATATARSSPLKASLSGDAYDNIPLNLVHNNYAKELLPKRLQEQHKVWRDIYNYDCIAGPTVDLYSNLPFGGGFQLRGWNDDSKEIRQVYEQSIANLQPEVIFASLLQQYLTLGKFCYHLLFDGTDGVWVDGIVYEPDTLSIQPVPIYGYDPIVQVKPTKEMRDFAMKTFSDPAMRHIRDQIGVSIPADLIVNLAAGKPVILPPSNTIYLPRKSDPNDYVGTSFYTRILPMVLYERALLNANISSANRRVGPTHIVTSSDINNWYPEPEELQQICQALLAAEDDPVRSVVGLNKPVNIETIEGGDWLKFTDEGSILKEMKLNGLGMSETLLSGDVSISTMDKAMSIFLERVRGTRNLFTHRVLYNKILEPLAEANDFLRTTSANVAHRVKTTPRTAPSRINSAYTSEKDSKYIIPSVVWNNRLQPTMDIEFIDTLERLEEKGIPINLETWASAAGVHLGDVLEGYHGDIVLRKEIQKYKDELQAAGLGPKTEDEGGAMFGSLKSNKDKWRPTKGLNNHPLTSGTFFCGVPLNIISALESELRQNPKAIRSARTYDCFIKSRNIPEKTAGVASFAMKLLGIDVPGFNSPKGLEALSSAITSSNIDAAEKVNLLSSAMACSTSKIPVDNNASIKGMGTNSDLLTGV